MTAAILIIAIVVVFMGLCFAAGPDDDRNRYGNDNHV